MPPGEAQADLETLLPDGEVLDGSFRRDGEAPPSPGSPAKSELVLAGLADEDLPCCNHGCSTAGGVANLVTTAVGAGMLALPCAVSKTGILLGGALFVLVACLTYASCAIIVRCAAKWEACSYGELVAMHFGRTGSVLLQTAIIVHVSGVMVGYNVIIADVLVGSAPNYNGVLPTLLGRHDGPWWLSRAAVLAALIVLVVLPTLVPRSLGAVAKFSSLSVCMLLVLAVSIAALAAVAVAKGMVAAGVQWLPDPAQLGAGPLEQLTTCLTVLSVGALAFTCQFNLLPIQKSLKDSSQGGMMLVLCSGLATCAVLYATVAVSGYALFGSAIEGDVLKGLTAKFVATLVHRSLAHAIVYGVALSYTVCLLANFVLKVWAVREAAVEMTLGVPACELEHLPFYALTAFLVAVAYAVSVMIPSIYGLLALVGATATVVFSYLFPSLVALKSGPTRLQQAGVLALMTVGLLMSATAIYDHLTGHQLE